LGIALVKLHVVKDLPVVLHTIYHADFITVLQILSHARQLYTDRNVVAL
jgi:hypothetical protein